MSGVPTIQEEHFDEEKAQLTEQDMLDMKVLLKSINS